MKMESSLVFALALAVPQETAPRSVEWRLYCAAMRAAEASLRLHETDQVARWLAEADAGTLTMEGRSHGSRTRRAACTACRCAPDGGRLAVGLGNGDLELWDASSGEILLWPAAR
jgi:hypothetical protein